jgi:hypothetical protein
VEFSLPLPGKGQRNQEKFRNRGNPEKVENLAHAGSLHFIFYNFGRIHKTLRVTPAMEAGVTDHIWSLEEMAALVD